MSISRCIIQTSRKGVSYRCHTSANHILSHISYYNGSKDLSWYMATNSECPRDVFTNIYIYAIWSFSHITLCKGLEKIWGILVGKHKKGVKIFQRRQTNLRGQQLPLVQWVPLRCMDKRKITKTTGMTTYFYL